MNDDEAFKEWYEGQGYERIGADVWRPFVGTDRYSTEELYKLFEKDKLFEKAKNKMKTIEVTDEMHEFLMNLSKEINTQDHRSTAMPYFFQIQTQEKVPAPEGCGEEAWIYDSSMIETEEELAEAISENKGISIEDAKLMSWHDRDIALEDAGYRKVNYEMKEVNQNAFLTSKACDEHIQANKHHYKKPVNYLVHSFRNPEMETLLKFLCGLTGGEIHK